MSGVDSLRTEHGFSPTGEFPFDHFCLLGVLVLVQVTFVRQCCVNAEEFIKRGSGGSESIHVLIFVCGFHRSFAIKGRRSYRSYILVVLLRPDILPVDPGPYVGSRDIFLERRANLTLKETQI